MIGVFRSTRAGIPAAILGLVSLLAFIVIRPFTSVAASSLVAVRTADGGSGGFNRAEHLDKPYVVLISFDALGADYVDRFDLRNFKRVLQRGARSVGMMSVFPSMTFPNHYSLVTGLVPERHGIVANSFFDPQLKRAYGMRDREAVVDGVFYRGEPIWVTAETQGMVAACFFWPGSEAPIKGVRPTMWNNYDGAITNQTRVDTVLEWLRLPAERRPHLITLYFSDLDTAGHGGPLDGPGLARAAQSVDAALGSLADGIATLPIRDRIYLLLTSDHGMVETSMAHTVFLDALIDPADVEMAFGGPVATLHIKGGPDGARRVRDRLNAGLRHGRAYLREETPERHRYRNDPRIGDVVIIMDESWTTALTPPAKPRLEPRWGYHGWDPALASMRAFFGIVGPGIPPGVTVPEVRNIDVYPLMTELLQIRPADDIDGRPGQIRQLIAKAPAARHQEPR